MENEEQATSRRGRVYLHAGTVVLTGEDLTVEQVARVAREGARVDVAPEAMARVRAARDVVERALARGDAVYGVTTGLGPLVRYQVGADAMERYLTPMVVGHAVTHGEQLPTEVVRAMMLARANGMVRGGVGVRAETVRALVDMLNAGVHPIVFQGGSVGQADLSEMAQIARVLMGLGEAEYGGQVRPGAAALAAAGLAPIQIKPKEALGLISANGVTLGQGALVLADLEDLLDTFNLSAALALEGFAGNVTIVHPAAARLKPHAGHRRAAEGLRALLQGSYLWGAEGARNLQDPLSFRCMPQVHGACYDAYDCVRRTLEVELNSASDNPLVSIDDDAVISVGNFDPTAVAVAFDMVRIALAQVIQLANERVQKQVWSYFSGLPTGLRLYDEPVGGLQSLARVCAALAAEAQALAGPVSLLYRAQLSEGIEDHASMAPLAVRQTARLVHLAWRLAALEMVVAARAIDLRGRPALGLGTQVAYDAVRLRIPLEGVAAEFSVEHAVEVVAAGRLIAAVRAAVAGGPDVTPTHLPAPDRGHAGTSRAARPPCAPAAPAFDEVSSATA